MTGETILVLNAGSSSLKFQLYDVGAGDTLSRRFKGLIGGIGTPHGRLRVVDGADAVLADERPDPSLLADVEAAQALLGDWFLAHAGAPPSAVGHRVVHGGTEFTAPVRVDAAMLARLEALTPLAPLHQPANLAPIRTILARRPELPQVACFDTAFHRRHGPLAERFAIPEALYARGIRRYGFHGLSYEYIAGHLGDLDPSLPSARVVVLHLGSGMSACALQDVQSIDSSMGFTALDGLPMGTRPGALDPGVVLYLAEQGMAPAAIEHLLYHECGLKGLSGISGDVRDLLGSDSPAAQLALDYLAYRAAGTIAQLGSAMGGLDAVVFTAGVGENAAPIRAAIARRCAWLGLTLDDARNDAQGPRLSAEGSRVSAWVLPTNEERMIARHTLDLLRGRKTAW
ncbi:acetate/propionate family kinase [Roseomonas sp. USHLN139]|uniref:acetate/propionate family kinase n=1 Tax=Roseomonas sp. USHLN139 TaxID=3081298 RepID=UPI003B01202D